MSVAWPGAAAAIGARLRLPEVLVRGVFGLLAALLGANLAQGLSSSGAPAFEEPGAVPSGALVSPVDVGPSGFEWPRIDGECETTFVEIEVRRAAWHSSVTASGGGVELVQYLDPDARGLRWLNVSPIARAGIAPGSRVVLEGRGLRLADRASRLVCFEDPELDGRRVLVIAPHPDDAEIAAFGIYASTDADVVTVTAGDAGGFNYRVLLDEPSDHYRLKGKIRTWDSIVVPFLGGVGPERARNLGYYDATLAELYRSRPEPLDPPIAEIPDPSYFRDFNVDAELRTRPMHPTWAGLVAALRAELDRVEPDVIVTAHPFLDNHRDHQYSTMALFEAMEGAETLGDEVVVLLYTNHLVGAEPFPWGPRDGIISVPPSAAGVTGHDGVYSHPVSDEAVALKILALEMMHDLRPLDLQEREPLGSLWKRTLKRTFRPERKRPNYSYLRRGPRPNELFWVLDRAGASRMREAFLDRLGE